MNLDQAFTKPEYSKPISGDRAIASLIEAARLLTARVDELEIEVQTLRAAIAARSVRT